MKRRVWRRWRPGETQPIMPVARQSRDTVGVTTCPVCQSLLAVRWKVEEGPTGPQRVRLLRCPNKECPRSRLGEGAG
jgi:hypothetical protein